jgi:SAM-dependent methyltransferase
MPELRDWYDTPLYYDIIFDADTPREADFLEAVHELHGLGGRSRRVLEPACGSGRLVLEMARRGWKVDGFDGNLRMLEFAKERVRNAKLKAELWEDWMQSFCPGKHQPYDMAHCLVSSFKYLLTGRHAAACLRRVADALKPGGLFVLGVHLTCYSNNPEEHERWKAERDGIRVVCDTHTWPADPQTRQENLRTRLRITQGSRTQTQETRWQFRTYNAAQIRRLLRSAPTLELVACHDFTYDLQTPRQLDDSYSDIVLILRRRSADP